MTNETALVQFNLQDTMSLGKVLADSGFFSDTKAAAQAVVKVLAGREMGFGPIASMTGVHIVQGKPSVGANLLGAAVKGSGRYNYRVLELTNEKATIEFYEGGEPVGRSEFTMQDAQAAGLTGNPTWKKFPRNMLFSRAMSNGARWFCPDVFSGVTPYTPEELGATVDGDGDVVDVTPTRVPDSVVDPVAKSEQTTNGHARPLDAETVRAVIRKKAGWQGDLRADGEPITEGQVKGVGGLLADAVKVDGMNQALLDKARHDILGYLVGVNETRKLTKAEASAIISWLKVDGDGWDLNNYARREVQAVMVQIAEDAGQQKLDI